MNNKHSIKTLNEAQAINKEIETELNSFNQFLTKTKDYINDGGLSDNIREECINKLRDVSKFIKNGHKHLKNREWK